jgi:hypothetical protein
MLLPIGKNVFSRKRPHDGDTIADNERMPGDKRIPCTGISCSRNVPCQVDIDETKSGYSTGTYQEVFCV